ncbi:MAG: hypothetical protein ACRCTY_04325, partial [Candidatus Adiutrix sp.]
KQAMVLLQEAVGDNLSEPLALAINATQKNLSTITNFYEKISFQDLAGQRLNKIEFFLSSLNEVVEKFIGKKAKKEAPIRKIKDNLPSTLKGPQAEGEALRQDDVDTLLTVSAELAPVESELPLVESDLAPVEHDV